MIKHRIIKDKRKISKNKGIQIYNFDNDKYIVYVGDIRKSKVLNKKNANKFANKILKERIRRINESVNRVINARKKNKRFSKFIDVLSKFV